MYEVIFTQTEDTGACRELVKDQGWAATIR